MKSVLIVSLLVLAAAARPKWHELSADYTFEQYQRDFSQKVYGPNERKMREKLFIERLAMVQAHNADATQPYKKGINHMSDWTEEERKAIRGTKARISDSTTKPLHIHVRGAAPLPETVDYRLQRPAVLSAIKDQGNCGSCWAHSATESIETHWAMTHGELFTLSQQQVTACTPDPGDCGGTGGCGGNIYEQAFNYVAVNGGIAQEWTYPYSAYWGDSGVCEYMPNQTVPVVKLAGYTKVMSNDEAAMADALANVGPLAIAVDASEWSDYETGVFTGCKYNTTIDHGVQLVGYGAEMINGTNVGYWIIRNSWSPAWGEAGFIRIVRPSETPCGWNVNNTYQGVGCVGGQSSVWACGTCAIAYDPVYPNVASYNPQDICVAETMHHGNVSIAEVNIPSPFEVSSPYGEWTTFMMTCAHQTVSFDDGKNNCTGYIIFGECEHVLDYMAQVYYQDNALIAVYSDAYTDFVATVQVECDENGASDGSAVYQGAEWSGNASTLSFTSKAACPRFVYGTSGPSLTRGQVAGILLGLAAAFVLTVAVIYRRNRGIPKSTADSGEGDYLAYRSSS